MKFDWSILGKLYMRTSQFSGLIHYGLDLKYKRWLKIYTIILIVALIGSFFQDILCNEFITLIDPSGFLSVIAKLQAICIRVCHIIMLIESVVRSRQMLALIIENKELEKSINLVVGLKDIHICCLTIEFRKILAISVFYFVVNITSLALQFLGQYDVQSLLNWFLYTNAFFVSCIRYLQLSMFIYAISYYIKTLKDFLPKLCLLPIRNKDSKAWTIVLEETGTMAVSEEEETLSVDESLIKLREIRRLYDQIWNSCGNISHCFGISTLMNLSYVLFSLTGNLFWLINSLILNEGTNLSKICSIIGTLIWISPYIINFYCVASLGYWVVQEVRILISTFY